MLGKPQGPWGDSCRRGFSICMDQKDEAGFYRVNVGVAAYCLRNDISSLYTVSNFLGLLTSISSASANKGRMTTVNSRLLFAFALIFGVLLLFSKADAHHKKDKDNAALTECTIQQPGGGGGCVAGFMQVCEKLKNGKKCCGCVPDKHTQAPAAEKIEDNPCFGFCSNQCGGATQEARDKCVLNCVQSTSCTKH